MDKTWTSIQNRKGKLRVAGVFMAVALALVAFALGRLAFGARSASAESVINCEIGLSVNGIEIAATCVADPVPGIAAAYELRLSGKFDVASDRKQIELRRSLGSGGSASATLAPSFVVGEGGGGFSNASYTGQELFFVADETYTLELWAYISVEGIGSTSSKSADSSVVFLHLYQLPPDPEPPAHHHFVGWYLDEALTEPYDGRQIYEDTDLYAKFEINQYTISFVVNWSGHPGKNNATVPALTYYNPEDFSGYREDRDFGGWYTDAALTALYDPAAPITGDMTLYAKWTVKMVTVTFIVGGEIYQALEVPYGTSLRYVAQTVAAQLGAQTMKTYLDPELTQPTEPAAALTGELAVYGVLSDGEDDASGGGWWDDVKSWTSVNKAYLIIGGSCLAAVIVIAAIVKKKRK